MTRAPSTPAGQVPDIIVRLREACNGHPHAKIEWPHRLLHDAITEIETLRATRPEPAPAGVEEALRRAAQDCLDEVDKMLAIDPPPIKYRAPYGSLARLRAALAVSKGGSGE